MTTTQDTTRTTAYTIHLANRMGEILPSRLKVAFQHSKGMDFQMADRLTLREMLTAAYMTGSAYEQVGKGVVMKDPVQKTEQFLNIGLISPSFK